MEVRRFDSYEAVKPLWEELNRTYKNGELTVDWTAHRIIWDHFYAIRGSRLMILAGLENGCCTGIFPFVCEEPGEPPQWVFSDDFIISREYFCPPDKIHLFRDLLPSHLSDDLSCFYKPDYPASFAQAPGGMVDLLDSPEAFLRSVGKKSRHALSRVLRDNSDIRIEVDNRVRVDEIQGILHSQLAYWLKKKGYEREEDYTYSRDKIGTDLALMQRAAEMGKLIALYFYLDAQLLAANFSVARETNRVDDYLCLRDCREPFSRRGLGFLAILKNMAHCRSRGIRYYDLSACMDEYKKRFINTDLSFYYLPRSSFRDPVQAGRDISLDSPVQPDQIQTPGGLPCTLKN